MVTHSIGKAMREYLRNYDIEQIRQARVNVSFTIGRKISYKENWDKRINAAIESIIQKEKEEVAKSLKNGTIDKENIAEKAPNKKVFEATDFSNRTVSLYF